MRGDNFKICRKILFLTGFFSVIFISNITAQCFDSGDISIVFDPPSEMGVYPFGTEVEICATLNGFTQFSVNWYQGMIFEFGDGWDDESISVVSMPTSCGGSGVWGYYDDSELMNPIPGVTGTGLAGLGGCMDISAVGGGFVFDYNGTSPLWGDSNAGQVPGCPQFCFNISTITATQFTGTETDLSVVAWGYSDAELGSWGGSDCLCTDPDASEDYIDPNSPTGTDPPSLAPCSLPPAPLIDGASLVCSQDVETYTITNAQVDVTYTWFDGAGNQIGVGASLVVDWGSVAPGDLTVQYINDDCELVGIAFFVAEYIIQSVPAPVVSISNTEPIALCPGETIDLNGSALPGLTTTELVFQGQTGTIMGNGQSDFLLNLNNLNASATFVEVCLDLEHANGSLLIIILEDPDGNIFVTETFPSISPPTVFDQMCFTVGATTPLTGSGTITGEFLPEVENFNSLTGTDLNGDWELQLLDISGNNGDLTGFSITVQVDNTLLPNTINWSSADGLITGATDQYDTTIDGPGTYTLSVADELGCTGYYDVIVESGSGQTPILDGPLQICANETNPDINSDLGGGLFSIDNGGVINPSDGVIDLAATMPGNYIVTYEIANAACPTTASHPITISPEPVVSILGLLPSYCSSEGIIDLNANPIDGQFTINGSSVLELNTALYNGTINVEYTITDINGCEGSDSFTSQVNVQEEAAFTISPLDLCEDELAFVSPTLAAGSTPGGTWTGPPGLAINPVTGQIDVANSIPGNSYAITYTTPGSLCNDSDQQFLAINANQSAVFTLQQSVCINQIDSVFPQLDLYATTGGVWSADFGVAINDSSGAIIPNQSTVGGPFNITYTTLGPCEDSYTQQINITGLEDATFSLQPAACLSDSPIFPVTNAATTLGGTWSASPPSGLFIDPFTGMITPQSSIAGFYTVSYTTPSPDCSSIFSQTIQINDAEDATFSIVPGVCENATINVFPTITGLPGGSFEMTPTIGYINPTTGEVDVESLAEGTTYTITYITPGLTCQSSSQQTLQVYSEPTLQFVSLEPAYCVNQGVVVFQANPPGGSFYVDNVLENDILLNGDPSLPSQFELSYEYTDANGCEAAINQTVFINALPQPEIINLDPAYCQTAGAITLEANPPGGEFTLNSIPTVVTQLNPTDFSANDVVTVNYQYTDANSCTGETSFTVNITESPNISFAVDNAYCTTDNPIDLVGSPAGGDFTINGNAGSQIMPADYPNGETLTVVYNYDDGAGCISETTEEVIINALPTLDITLDAGYCVDYGTVTLTADPGAGEFFINNTLTTNVNTADYSAGDIIDVLFVYTDAEGCENNTTESFEIYGVPNMDFTNLDAAYCVTSAAVNVAAEPPGGTFELDGVDMGTSLTLDPTSYAAGETVTVEYTFTDANNCTNTIEQDVNIDDAPNILTGLNPSYCSDAGIIDLVGNPAGGEFQINGTVETAINTGYYSPPSTLNVQYTWDDGTGCSNVISETIEILALPEVSIDNQAAYCIDEGVVVLAGNQASGTFIINGLPVTEFDTGDYVGGDIISVDYEYVDASNCENSASLDITINDLPAVEILNLDGSYCTSSSDFVLDATPAGGEFTIAGAVVTSFDPGTFAAGDVVEVIYSLTDANNCSAQTSLMVSIEDVPALSTNLASTYCQNDDIVDLVGDPASGEFTIGGNTVTQFDPSTFGGVPTVDVVFSYDDGAGCSNTITETITLNPVPSGSFTIDELFCSSDPVIVLGATPIGGTFTVDDVDATEIDPSDYTTYTLLDVEYTYTDPTTTCTTIYSTPVEINPAPQPAFVGLAEEYCDGASIVSLNATPTGGEFFDDSGAITQFDPSTVAIGSSVEITYEIVDANGCFGSVSQTVSVVNNASASIDAIPNEVCTSDDPIALAGSPAGGTFSGDGVVGNTFDPSLVAAGQTYTIDYAYTDPSGCSATADAQINVVDLEDASFSFPQNSYCINAAFSIPDSIANPGGTFTANNGLAIDPSTGEIELASGIIGQSYIITYETAGACPNSETFSISISESDNTNFGYSSTSFCIGSTNPLPVFVGTANGTFSSTDVTINNVTGEVDLSTAQIGDIYSITYETTGACASTSTIQIEVDEGDSAAFAMNNSIFCPNDTQNPTATNIATPGGIFSIDGGLNIDPLSGEINIAEAVGGQTYTITYTTIGGCSNATTQQIEVLAVPELQLISNDGICTGQQIEVDLNITNESSLGYTIDESSIIWNLDDGNVVNGTPYGPYTLTFDQPGYYEVSATVNNDCPVEMVMTGITVQDLSIFTIEDLVINYGEMIELSTTASSPDANFNWNPNINLSCTDCPSPFANPIEDVMYTVLATDPLTGCLVSDSINVEVVFAEPYVPNVFTPNGDGTNDKFEVFAEGLENFYMAIYNRWGERVFETFNQETGWDGSFHNTDLDPDVFVYILRYTYINGEEGMKKGNVTLVR